MFYNLLGRFVWMIGIKQIALPFIRWRLARTNAVQRAGAAAVVVAVVGLGVWAATRDADDEAV